jgi:hypothetical protein
MLRAKHARRWTIDSIAPEGDAPREETHEVPRFLRERDILPLYRPRRFGYGGGFVKSGSGGNFRISMEWTVSAIAEQVGTWKTDQFAHSSFAQEQILSAFRLEIG